MQSLKCTNSKTGKGGFLEIREDGYFLITKKGFSDQRQYKFLGKKARTALRFFQRKGWRVVPPKQENMDIARRNLE